MWEEGIGWGKGRGGLGSGGRRREGRWRGKWRRERGKEEKVR